MTEEKKEKYKEIGRMLAKHKIETIGVLNITGNPFVKLDGNINQDTVAQYARHFKKES